MNQKNNHSFTITLFVVGIIGLMTWAFFQSLEKDGVLRRLIDEEKIDDIHIYKGPQVSFYTGDASMPTQALSSTSGFVSAPVAISHSSVCHYSKIVSGNTGYSLRTSSSAVAHSVGGGFSQNGGSSYSKGTRATTTQSVGSSASAYAYIPSVQSSGSTSTGSNATRSSWNDASMQGGSLSQPATTSGPRKVYSSSSTTDGAGNYWDEDEEAWLPIPTNPGSYIGETKYDNATGISYTWNGTEWVQTASEVNLNTPLGAIPYIFIIFCLAGYLIMKQKHKEHEAR